MRPLAIAGMVCCGLALAGCGGGGGKATTRTPGMLARFDVDVATGKVTVTQQSSGRAVVTGGAVSFTSSDLISIGGDSGKRLIRINATNRSGETWTSPRLIIENIENSATAAVKAAVNVSTFAGYYGAGTADGYRTDARLSAPTGVATGAGPSRGAVFVGDTDNHTIRRIEADGMVSTFAGTAGSATWADGTGAAARFSSPHHLAVDSSGNVFVADRGNHRIRRITPLGEVTTIAGDGTDGNTDGPGNTAKVGYPTGLAVSEDGNRVYVTCNLQHTVRLVKYVAGARDLAGSYTVTTIAGSAGSSGTADGVGGAARFNRPYGVALLRLSASDEVLFIGDFNNGSIRRIDAPSAGSASVSTVAGTGAGGYADGPGSTAILEAPMGLAASWIDASRFAVFFCDNDRLRVLFNTPGAEPTQAGSYSVVTLAGLGGGFADGDGNSARFDDCSGVAAVPGAGPSATLFVADDFNNRIRQANVGSGAIHSGGAASAVTEPVRVVNWDALVPNRTAYAAVLSNPTSGLYEVELQFYIPSGVSGFSFTAYVECDTSLINVPAAGAAFLSTLAGKGPSGMGMLDGPGNAAQLAGPMSVLAIPVAKRAPFWTSGGTWARGLLAEIGTNRIRYIDEEGGIGTFVGSSVGYADGVLGDAKFYYPTQMGLHPDGSVILADWGNNRIRRITPSGVVTTVAGTGASGHADGAGDVAVLNGPRGLAVTAGGVILVADSYNHVVRRITRTGSDSGLASSYTVTTIAGLAGTMGNADGVGTSARFQNPSEMACWPDGRVFVADYNNDAVRVLTNTGAPGATVSTLGAVARPYGVALDPAGNVYVSSYTEHRITRFSPVGSGTVICGIPTPGFQDGTGGRFNGPCGLSMEEGGSLLVADFDNHAVRLVERILSAAQAP